MYPELLSPPARTHSGQPESSAAKALLLTSSGARGEERRMAKPRPFYGELSSTSDVLLPDWLQPINRVVVMGKAELMEWKTTWHMRRLFVYYLEHRMSAPSCNGECEGGSSQSPDQGFPISSHSTPDHSFSRRKTAGLSSVIEDN